MGLIKKISAFFKSPANDRNFWFYVRCDHCHEVLKGRVDMYNHLSIEFGEGRSGNSYFCRKVMIGSNRCYIPIEVEFYFDSNRKLIERKIQGGTFVEEIEYSDGQNIPG